MTTLVERVRNVEFRPKIGALDRPDRHSLRQASKDPEIEQLLKKYDEVVLNCSSQLAHYGPRLYIKHVFENSPIIPPNKINTILQIIRTSYDDTVVNSDFTGRFVSRAMELSFNAGNNDFGLNTGDSLIPGLAREIGGKSGLRVTVGGNTGGFFGYVSEGISAVISGNCHGENIGSKSSNCSYVIEGQLSGNNAQESKNNLYQIKGGLKGILGGLTSESTFMLEGGFDLSIGSGNFNTYYLFMDRESSIKIHSASRDTFVVLGDGPLHLDIRWPLMCSFITDNQAMYDRLNEEIQNPDSNYVNLRKKTENLHDKDWDFGLDETRMRMIKEKLNRRGYRFDYCKGGE